MNGTVDLSGGSGVAYFEYGITSSYGTDTALQTIPAGSRAVPVAQGINGLLANTTYHFRVVGSNASGGAYGADQIFTTAASAPPDAVSSDASAVGLTTAMLNGRISSNSSPTMQRFEFGTSTAYGLATPWEAVGSDVTNVTFSAVLEALTPNTLYHFRIVAVNGSGTTVGGDQTFTTAVAQALFTYTFSDVTSSSGTSSAGGFVSNTTFSSFAATGVSTNSGASGRFSFSNQTLGATNGSDIFTGTLNPAKYFQMSATPAAGFTLNASSITFTLQRSSTGVRQSSVRGSGDAFGRNLAAAVTPANANLMVVATPEPNIFEVSDTSTAANPGSTVTLDPKYAALNAAATFRFYGFNAESTVGTFSVDDVTVYGLVTPGGVPSVSNLNADAISTTTANLTGTLNPKGAAVTFYVLYGTAAQYGSATASQIVPGETTAVPLAQALSGLRSYTAYHYQIVAANSTGVFASADQSFTTAAGDRDGDGIPDDWEVQHGLNADDAADALLDADGDGLTNLQEFTAGTDPRNGASRLQIVATRMGLDGFEIAFTTAAGRKYRLEATDVLYAPTWTVVADNVIGTGAVVSVVDESLSGTAQRFYRIQLIP